MRSSCVLYTISNRYSVLICLSFPLYLTWWQRSTNLAWRKSTPNTTMMQKSTPAGPVLDKMAVKLRAAIGEDLIREYTPHFYPNIWWSFVTIGSSYWQEDNSLNRLRGGAVEDKRYPNISWRPAVPGDVRTSWSIRLGDKTLARMTTFARNPSHFPLFWSKGRMMRTHTLGPMLHGSDARPREVEVGGLP